MVDMVGWRMWWVVDCAVHQLYESRGLVLLEGVAAQYCEQEYHQSLQSKEV